MGKIFKKSLMGFSKEQVIAYIDALVDKQKAALEEEKEKYAQLQEENEKLINERDNAVEVAMAELQGTIDSLNDEFNQLNSEKDAIFVELEDVKGVNASLAEENAKLKGEKNELFESINTIKAQLNDAINKENENKAKIQGLENENNELKAALEQVKNIKADDSGEVRELQDRVSRLIMKNAQLEAQLSLMHTVSPAKEKQDENTEEVWENLREKINGLATDFSSLADSVRAEETRGNESKKISIRDILERVKRIGEKI
ncbi:MAG: hypothetical protein IKV63_06770 [Clostridia bacterium]|nr:hypothetical protein [Clostridia bacterium]